MNQFFPSDNPTFDDMLQAGRVALQAGKPELAHDIWRETAKKYPYDERVWLALLDVIDTDSDRLVCLRNIISINPLNIQAQRHLNAIEARSERHAERLAEQEYEEMQQETMWRIRRRSILLRSFLMGLVVGLSGLLFALVIIILRSLT